MLEDAKPCFVCGRMLEPVMPGGNWDSMQPYGGGEVRLIFSYGSVKFDKNYGGTSFRGIVCDDCTEERMDRLDGDNNPERE